MITLKDRDTIVEQIEVQRYFWEKKDKAQHKYLEYFINSLVSEDEHERLWHKSGWVHEECNCDFCKHERTEIAKRMIEEYIKDQTSFLETPTETLLKKKGLLTYYRWLDKEGQ